MSATTAAGPSPDLAATAVVDPDEPAWSRLERVRARPNRRSLLFATLGLLLYGAGANVGAGWVIALAALLLGTLPFAWITARRAAGELAVRRTGPRITSTDSATPLTLEIRGPTSASAVVHDHLSGAAGATRDLRGGARLTAAAWLPRGHVSGGAVSVVITDIFGLVEARAEGDVASDIEVLPAVPEVHGLRSRVAWAVEAGSLAARQGGGSEVIGVREYQHGDPVRSVHWRSSARRDQLVVREYAEDSRPRVLVELAGGTWERASLDIAVEAASGIAQDARRTGHPTDVAADGGAGAWSHATRRRLALLPPHASAEPRPLSQPPYVTAQMIVRFEPAAEGTRIVVRAGGSLLELGTLPQTTAREAIGTWLTQRLEALS